MGAKTGNGVTRDNAELHAAREELHHDGRTLPGPDQAESTWRRSCASRIVDIAVKQLYAQKSDLWANTDINKASRMHSRDARAVAVEALRRVRYFVRQADWLQERFPDAELRDVEGLVKLVDRAEIARRMTGV